MHPPIALCAFFTFCCITLLHTASNYRTHVLYHMWCSDPPVVSRLTAFDDPLAPHESVAKKFVGKMAGTQQVFEKPRTMRT